MEQCVCKLRWHLACRSSLPSNWRLMTFKLGGTCVPRSRFGRRVAVSNRAFAKTLLPISRLSRRNFSRKVYGPSFFPAGNGDGGQGEFVRVPLADGTLVKVPGSTYSDEIMKSLLTLSDVMGTGHHAAVSAEVEPGDTVAVVGDGAVGLCAILAAKRLGAVRILALSRHPARQQLAREFGATDIVEERGEAAVEAVKHLTNGIGVDAALECVGTNEAMQTALAIARPGSIVGYVGVPHGVEMPVPTLFYRNIGAHGGPAPARAYLPALLDDVLAGRINPGRVFDFTTDLDGIAQAYAAMDERRAIKSLVKVGTV